jgi:4-hydroxybenzoyl-CoA thioesterase
VRSGDPATATLELTTHCLIVFVPLQADGSAAVVRTWVPVSEEDIALEAHARNLIDLRSAVESLPDRVV